MRKCLNSGKSLETCCPICNVHGKPFEISFCNGFHMIRDINPPHPTILVDGACLTCTCSIQYSEYCIQYSEYCIQYSEYCILFYVNLFSVLLISQHIQYIYVHQRLTCLQFAVLYWFVWYIHIRTSIWTSTHQAYTCIRQLIQLAVGDMYMSGSKPTISLIHALPQLLK